MKVIIVDDHKIVREGIRLYLDSHEQVEAVEEFDNGHEAISYLEKNDIPLVVMDINMEKMNGIDATRSIKSKFKDIKILALTMHNDYQHIKSMMDAGASGYLLKNCNEQEMHEAIDKVMAGEIYYSPQVAQTVMNNFSRAKSTSGQQIPLTPREKEILKLIMEEKSNQEIAEELFISVRTVEVHKRNLIEKTGAKNSTGLVLYAVKNNLLDNL